MPERPLLRFDGIEFDAAELRLVREGEVIELQPKVSRLLEFLVSRAGQLVAKEELIDQLWPDTVVRKEALTQLVRKLRKALGDDAHQPRYVQTVTTRGYRFLPQVMTVMVAAVEEAVVSRAWSPDGRHLAWTDETRLLVVPAAGGTARPVGESASYVRSVRWEAATGALLRDAAWHGRNDLWRVDPDSGRREALTAAGGNLFHPAASRDGRRLVYVQEAKEQVVLALDREGRHPTPLATKTTLRCLNADPAGRWIAFTDDDPSGESGHVGVMPLGGGAVRALSGEKASHPAFSPDGSALAFIRHAADGERLALVSSSGGEIRLASSAVGSQLRAPAFSPDGRRLAVAGPFAHAGQGLHVCELGSGVVGRVVSGTSGHWPGSPKGTRSPPVGLSARGWCCFLSLSRTGRYDCCTPRGAASPGQSLPPAAGRFWCWWDRVPARVWWKSPPAVGLRAARSYSNAPPRPASGGSSRYLRSPAGVSWHCPSATNQTSTFWRRPGSEPGAAALFQAAHRNASNPRSTGP